MFKFIKKFFMPKVTTEPTAIVEVDPASYLMDNVKINITDQVDLERILSFRIMLGFDVEPGKTTEPSFNLHINQVMLISDNENAKRYVEISDDKLLKRTIAMLCVGASRHVVATPLALTSPDTFPEEILDKSKMN